MLQHSLNLTLIRTLMFTQMIKFKIFKKIINEKGLVSIYQPFCNLVGKNNTKTHIQSMKFLQTCFQSLGGCEGLESQAIDQGQSIRYVHVFQWLY